MIQFTYDITSGRLQARFEANTMQETIEHISELNRILRADTNCGFCESDDLRVQMRRTKEGFKYYELTCGNPECGARLQLHEQKNEARTMYVVHYENGEPLPNRGWEKWSRGESRGDGPRAGGPEPRDEEVPESRRR